MTDAGAIVQELDRIVHDLWWRLPAAVRTVISRRSMCVVLCVVEERGQHCYEDGHVMLFLDEPGISEAWKEDAIQMIVWGFALAFLDALFLQVARHASEATSGTEEIEGGDGQLREAVSQMANTLVFQAPDIPLKHMIWQMAEAIARAWGFGEELTAPMP